MIPYLHLWHFSIPTFGLMLWLAAVAAAFVMDRGFKRASLDADAVGMVAIAVLAGIVGAKLWHVIDTPSEFRDMGWRVLWDTAGFAWFGGMVFGISALLFQGWWAENRIATDIGSGGTCGGHWLWNWADRVLSFRRRVLWSGDKTSMGHEFSQWNRAYAARSSSTSHPAV